MNIQEEFIKDKTSLLTVVDFVVWPFILREAKMCQHFILEKNIKIFFG